MRVRIFLLISALALFFDQITKLSAQRLLVPYQIKPVIGNLVRITLVYNPRGLFGLPIGSGLSYYILPLVGVAIVIYFATRTKSFLYLCSYALILGGAIGNLWDRIRLGKVIDFIDIGVKNIRWYTFNLADMFIVIGIIMLIATEIFHPRPATEKVEEKDTAKDNQTN
ncbi:MAG: signal peptidase II [candidate division WOR-3 bacterium]|nr:signal peptidase II [candidate division WOR-3 bacterium]